MNTQRITRSILLAALLSSALPVLADGRDGRGGDHDRGHERVGWVLDNRYNHNHYYPPRGYEVHGLPHNYITVRHLGSPYYFSEGIWYRPGRFGFSVIAPPIGVFLPILPPYYSTVWFGGIPYYYADDVYYVRDATRNGYVVAAPPAESEASTAPASGNDLFTYPKNGQSEEQQAKDRYECHRWAADQTGFDVTQPQGGVNNDQINSKRTDYRRAQVACLEGRGYSVK
jgi:hypothetical protein